MALALVVRHPSHRRRRPATVRRTTNAYTEDALPGSVRVYHRAEEQDGRESRGKLIVAEELAIGHVGWPAGISSYILSCFSGLSSSYS